VTTAVATGPTALALGRVAAVLVGCSVAVHLLQVAPDSLASLAMVAMAVACLPCAWHLWRAPTPPAWRLMAGIDLGMLLLHLPMTAGVAASAGHHAAGASPGLLWLGSALIVGQLALAARVLLATERRSAR
jgi:hypothetical protein